MIVLLLAVALPFLAVPVILALRRQPNPREAASLLASVGTFVLVASLIPSSLAGAPAAGDVVAVAPGLSIGFRADLLGLLFASVASLLWIPTTVYSIGYMRGRKEHAQTRYFACFASVIGATMGVALAANLFTLLVFYEILTISTYPLVAHEGTAEAHRAGRKYLIYTLGGGAAILAGLAISFGSTGDVAFVEGGNPSLATLPPETIQGIGALLLAGFGVKATLFPLQGWLPSAMVAPTPVSGLLHAVAVVKAGVFGILRTVFFFVGPGLTGSVGLQSVLLTLAVATILYGSFLALTQDNLKLRLAYSTISQLSYIVLGAALLSPAGLLGAAFHIAAHGFAKLSMFFVAGSIALETGKTRISELDGIGRRMPGTMVAFAIAAVAMASLPPMAPFVSKWYLSVGAWEAGQWLPVLVLAISSVLNVAYFFPIVVRAFFFGAPGGRGEGTRPVYGPVLATALGALVLGVWTALPFGPFEIARSLARGLFP